MTATYTRKKETMERYLLEIQKPKKGCFFEQGKNNPKDILYTFKHWLIIENKFPYDAIASTSHIIFPKRSIVFDWSLLNQEEKEEFEELHNSFIKNNYDTIWENLPSGQTIPKYFHLHLLVLKRTSIDEFMKNS